MKHLVLPLIFLGLAGCQPICAAFPEWDEAGYQVDVEHDSQGNPETGFMKVAGQVLEVGIDPACALGARLGIVSKPVNGQ